jgi:ABC-type branched-subunit amino acid transport system permease subunit
MSVDFWIGVAVVAGIYGIAALGLQLNAGFTGLLNFGQAGFMAIGAYSMSLLVVDQGWPLPAAIPVAIAASVLAALLVGVPSLRLRSDYFAISTIAFAEIVRYVFQNAEFAGGNQGMLGYDQQWRSFAGWLSTTLAPFGMGNTQLPLLFAIWIIFALALLALNGLEHTPWGRILKGVREDEDAVAALGKNVLAYKLQSLAIGAALGAISGIFLALNVTYLYPGEFDPTVTFFAYSVLILGGFASYWGIIIGTLLFWAIMEGLRFIDLPLSTNQLGSLRLVLVGLILVVLMMIRPQGLLGRKAEMQSRQ